jgi:hypothetical protein
MLNKKCFYLTVAWKCIRYCIVLSVKFKNSLKQISYNIKHLNVIGI